MRTRKAAASSPLASALVGLGVLLGVSAAGLSAAGSLAGCGASTANHSRISSPMTPELEVVFENGADFVDDVSVLEGTWREDWEREIDLRVSNADAIAVVQIRALRTDENLDGMETFRIQAEITENLYGDMGEEISLPVRQGEGGYGTIESNQRRLLEGDGFLVFVKWADIEGAEVPRWHITLPSQPTLERVSARIRARRGNRERRTVIVHRNNE